ncbi:hypothetical protein FDG92_gp03 [Arthrobacter phage Jasmine]|uniref:Uncharacterized protein n=1 Tax=Arthrobacter phage Jasmine TaxID=1772302 RepID=A0A0U4JRQ8_9CAUD|nr:hypothetical protein FDG92_gp03 [Arthrobacter phage Jasmine]ALY09275.1 hypothetical protein JASMINE_3 [Arthrobacter phage Jasmine]
MSNMKRRPPEHINDTQFGIKIDVGGLAFQQSKEAYLMQFEKEVLSALHDIMQLASEEYDKKRQTNG